mgnify:CR=1 FL=1
MVKAIGFISGAEFKKGVAKGLSLLSRHGEKFAGNSEMIFRLTDCGLWRLARGLGWPVMGEAGEFLFGSMNSMTG